MLVFMSVITKYGMQKRNPRHFVVENMVFYLGILGRRLSNDFFLQVVKLPIAYVNLIKDRNQKLQENERRISLHSSLTVCFQI